MQSFGNRSVVLAFFTSAYFTYLFFNESNNENILLTFSLQGRRHGALGSHAKKNMAGQATSGKRTLSETELLERLFWVVFMGVNSKVFALIFVTVIGQDFSIRRTILWERSVASHLRIRTGTIPPRCCMVMAQLSIWFSLPRTMARAVGFSGLSTRVWVRGQPINTFQTQRALITWMASSSL